MANKDGFPPHDRFPVFLSEQAEEAGQPDIEKVLGRATISSRILKTSIFAVTATAIAIGILLVGDPVELVANVTASWVDKSALQPDADSSTSTIQSIADSQDLPPTTRDTPTRDEIAAAAEPADQSQAENSLPPAETLLKQFEAWAAQEDSRAQVEEPKQPVQVAPVQPAQAAPVQPAQAAPVQVAQDAPAQAQPAKKHRRARSVHNARAELRTQRNHRAKVREEQNAPAPVAPVPDARAQEQPVQNSPFPWLPQSFGGRN